MINQSHPYLQVADGFKPHPSEKKYAAMLVKLDHFPLRGSFLKPTTDSQLWLTHSQNLQVSRAEAADMSAKPQIGVFSMSYPPWNSHSP